MNPQYRIYNKIGERYFTEHDYSHVSITPYGRVKYSYGGLGCEDITDQVVVEFEAFVRDINGNLLFEGDKFILDGSSNPVEEYVIHRNTDGRLMSVCPSNNKLSIPLSCCCVALMKVIGTIHDKEQSSNP